MKKNIEPKQKQLYYARRAAKIKNNRVSRKNEARAGRTNTRNLSFLSAIVKAFGFNQRALAEALGCTAQNIHWMFVNDDCALSRAEEILANFGLTLRVEIVNAALPAPPRLKNAVFRAGSVRNRVKGDLLSAAPAVTHFLPSYILHCPADARLRFLADYIIALGVSVSEAERVFGMCRGNLVHIFRRDDINVSRILAIAKATDATEVVWHID